MPRMYDEVKPGPTGNVTLQSLTVLRGMSMTTRTHTTVLENPDGTVAPAAERTRSNFAQKRELVSDYTIHNRLIPSTDQRLGRNVHHDSRSRAFAFRPERLTTYVSVLHQRYIPILDQGDIGSCTGNAATGHIGSGDFYAPVQGLFTGTETTAVGLYEAATALDSYTGTYPPNDTGSDGLSVAKAAQKAGFISGYLHTFSFDDFMAAVQKQPVIVGVNWYSNMFNPDARGLVTIPKGDTVSGGHEFVIRGYDDAYQELLADNSWGMGWGAQGTFRIGLATMKRLLAEDGDCTMFVPLTSAPPQPTPPVPSGTDAALVSAGNAWEKSILSKISKAGKFRTAFDAWKAAKGY